MKTDIAAVKIQLEEMALSIARQEEPSKYHYHFFIQEPMHVFSIVQLIAELDAGDTEVNQAYFSACIFALDVCIAQLQSALENGSKQADKSMQQVMSVLAEAMHQHKQGLLFWLPVLNAFYDVQVELSAELREAYLTLVDEEDEQVSTDEVTHLNSIRELIAELSDLTVFDIAENFFAQSYAMPPDFFSDLLFDLYSLPEGQDIGLLALMHPEYEVREVVISTLDILMPQVRLSSQSLSRLQVMTAWYPEDYQDQLNHWIREQRRKEVVFHKVTPAKIVKIQASEIDGGGAQGLFIHFKRGRQHRLCGLLVKYGLGVKDIWLTPYLSITELKDYEHEVFDDTVMLREVDLPYFQQCINHFLSITLERGSMPDLHLLELQEEIGLHCVPKRLDIQACIEDLSVQISPFTPDIMHAALTRTKQWSRRKRFTESWYLESAAIDKMVNRYCSFIDGVKVCDLSAAMTAVFDEEFEKNRERWIFHFMWVQLWLKSHARKNETTWQDAFFIAYAIYTGIPMSDIPIMQSICRHTILHSVETMQERKTYLSQE